MEAGKHVFIEKPMALSLEDARRLIRVRDRTGCRATVDYMLRFNAIVEALRWLTQEKAFGELRRVDMENYAQDTTLPPEHWFWDPTVAGGILIEHGVHFIDLVHDLTGRRWLQVTGVSCARNERQKDQALANVLYEGGFIATHYHSFSRPGFFEHTSIRLAYDLAQVDVEGWIPLSGRITALVNAETEGKLLRLPGFRVLYTCDLARLEDVSRPEGWGGGPSERPSGRVRSGGVDYEVDKFMEGEFTVGRSKGEIYAECLRAMMRDFIAGVKDSTRPLRVELEDGLTSLQVALLATKFARSHAKAPEVR